MHSKPRAWNLFLQYHCHAEATRSTPGKPAMHSKPRAWNLFLQYHCHAEATISTPGKPGDRSANALFF
ncbi:hypothetical protein DPMN_188544 [Dreissena polymorpha]|uniref:Uncharacterized protein n=1 Tax=Dreissena polymorpha TaxID=45954 RepID=A0A9D4IBF5_DREPO|nr:hypothetical protein DPMN_188544 [Dreissena polymorpha]